MYILGFVASTNAKDETAGCGYGWPVLPFFSETQKSIKLFKPGAHLSSFLGSLIKLYVLFRYFFREHVGRCVTILFGAVENVIDVRYKSIEVSCLRISIEL